MMLCVIYYWVYYLAQNGGRSSSSAVAFFHAKLLKRRDVYLKLTRHNGRAGTHGTYNPKHNDRSFNLANSEHIDPERAKGNIYWDCFHGFRSALDPQDPDDLATTFSDVERQFYETHYTAFIESQNERNAKIRHTERNRSIPDLLSSRKTCPEETIWHKCAACIQRMQYTKGLGLFIIHILFHQIVIVLVDFRIGGENNCLVTRMREICFY